MLDFLELDGLWDIVKLLIFLRFHKEIQKSVFWFTGEFPGEIRCWGVSSCAA